MGTTSLTTAEAWDTYRLRLTRKILSELSHERFLTPQRVDADTYVVRSDDGATEYSFTAQVLALDSWCIDEASIRRTVDGTPARPDPIALVADFGTTLGLTGQDTTGQGTAGRGSAGEGTAGQGSAGQGRPGDELAAYLEELTHTLALGADRPAERRIPVAELAAGSADPVAGFQAVEAARTEGPPGGIATAGRIGFTTDDLPRYAPEHGGTTPLNWLAIRAEHVTFAAMDGVGYDELIDSELGPQQRAAFAATLADRGLDPAAYRLLPAHPWQWRTTAARLFAREIADGEIVDLGPGADEYQAQQSIRTLFNRTEPARRYVKVSLSITNMGFTRGMSADYMSSTPLINDWVHSRIGGDEYLRSIGFEVRYEAAAIGYRNPAIQAVTAPGSEYRKMLAALWRESPVGVLREGEQLATMASLLHVDHLGHPMIGALIARSGLTPRQWLRRYLEAYLHPVIYLLYAHELKFSPHGENLILVLVEGAVTRVILKDIGEEVFILGECPDLPPEGERAQASEPDSTRNLGILSDVFDDFFRPLACVLHGHGLLTDDEFWDEVAASVDAFQSAHPALADRFARWDLWAPTFGAIHLNRLQIGNRTRMVDHDDSYASMVAAGHELANPIAGRRPTPATSRSTLAGVR